LINEPELTRIEIYRGGFSMKQSINIQDQFLNQLRKENISVTVFLLNGFQLRGHVKGFDNFTIILESEGKQQLVYKHAISTFAPQRNVSLKSEE
jgi:host factor-I protein